LNISIVSLISRSSCKQVLSVQQLYERVFVV